MANRWNHNLRDSSPVIPPLLDTSSHTTFSSRGGRATDSNKDNSFTTVNQQRYSQFINNKPSLVNVDDYDSEAPSSFVIPKAASLRNSNIGFERLPKCNVDGCEENGLRVCNYDPDLVLPGMPKLKFRGCQNHYCEDHCVMVHDEKISSGAPSLTANINNTLGTASTQDSSSKTQLLNAPQAVFVCSYCRGKYLAAKERSTSSKKTYVVLGAAFLLAVLIGVIMWVVFFDMSESKVKQATPPAQASGIEEEENPDLLTLGWNYNS